MTDDGPAFKSRRYAKTLRRLRVRHLRTPPYTPKTNGKVERCVQTCLREGAYARPYDTFDQRKDEPPAFLFRYNRQRPHMGINAKTPISRLGLSGDDPSRLHSWSAAGSHDPAVFSRAKRGKALAACLGGTVEGPQDGRRKGLVIA